MRDDGNDWMAIVLIGLLGLALAIGTNHCSCSVSLNEQYADAGVHHE